VIIEDTPEIQCAAPNCLIMQTSEHFDTRRALTVAMRGRPDRIIVGEVRGGELVEQEHHRQFGLRLVAVMPASATPMQLRERHESG